MTRTSGTIKVVRLPDVHVKTAKVSASPVAAGYVADLPDMIDRLTCMANEKDCEVEGPFLSAILKETARADAKALRRAISMIVALYR